MLKFLEYIQDIIFTLLGQDPQQMERRRRLREINNELHSIKPGYYRRATRTVLPEFALAILELLACLRPLRELFDRTVSAEDPKLAQRFSDYLVVARLPAHLQDIYGTFTFDNLRRRVVAAASPDTELGGIERDLTDFLGNFADAEFYSFDAEYAALQRLISLCRHSHTHLLTLFDPDFDPLKRQAAPNFRPAPADDVLPELLDLYYLVAGLDLSASLERNLDYLVERLSREGAEEAKRRTRKVLARLRQLIAQHLSPAILLALIRSISQDPQASPEVISEQPGYLQEFRSRFQAHFNRLREKIQWELHENAVREDLKRLFGGADLLPIEGFREELARNLQELDYECFASIRPLSILKSFVAAHFERTLRGLLKRLVVEGKFENRIFQNMFTDTFFRCEGLMEKIVQTEEELQGSGALSVKKLQHFVQMYSQGKPVHNIVAKFCEGIEKALRELLDEGASLLYNLSVLLLEILNDTRQKNPQRVANIRSLGGGTNEQYLAALSAGYDNLYLFVKVIKNFARVRQLEIETR